METKEKEIEMKEEEKEEEEEKESEQKEDGSEKASEAKPKISMKTAVIIGIIIIFGALLFYCKGLFIAATVDGAPISRISVIRQLESESGKKALEDMIIKQLLNKAAREKGIKITSEDIDAEIQKIEEQVKAQGGTLDEMLSAQGMTRESVSEQIMLQKKIEKLLEDKVQVTDEEAEKLVADSKVTVPKGEEEKFKTQAKEQIRVQKMNNELGAYIESLKTQAKIRYFVNY
jgi:parvulin-like peptidyl-prolyl isomerase